MVCVTPEFAAAPKLIVALAPLLIVCIAAIEVLLLTLALITVVPKEVPEPLYHVIVQSSVVLLGDNCPLIFVHII